jgi:Domain of unknown function (DUF1929)
VDLALQRQPPVAAAATGQLNLLRNADFETVTADAPVDWVSCATTDVPSSSEAASGLRAGMIAANRCLYQSVRVNAGQHLSLNCHAKLVQDRGWTGWGLNFYDASFQKVGSAPTRRIESGTYERYATSALAPARAAYATVWAYSEGEALLDQCQLSELDPSSPNEHMTNGGFEENLANWSPCASSSPVRLGLSVQGGAHTGARALRLTPNGCAYQEADLRPNHEYEITCQASVSGYRHTELSLIFADTNWKPIVREGVQVSSATYSNHRVRLITPAATVHAVVAIYNQSDEARFDACSLRDTGLEITASPSLEGQWSDVQPWPLLAIHTALLPTGEVLAWDSNNDDVETNTILAHPFRPTRATLWNPLTNAFTSVDADTGKDLFCAGLSVIANGNLLVAGGNQVPDNGSHTAITIFDSKQRSWSRGPNMTYSRWYPSVTNLANGDALITGGGPAIPEVYSSAGSGSLRVLSTASLKTELYPWMQLAPNGKVVHFGPEATAHSLETGTTGQWTALGTRDAYLRDYGSYAMFAPGKILVTGGGVPVEARSSSQILDLNRGLSVSNAANMTFARRQHNLTLLPDGTVLASGGVGSSAKQIDVKSPVFAAEVWNPTANRWATMASEKIPRQYHATALLLPDGRVLSAGGGFCGNCPLTTYFHRDAQVFSPTYLFNKDGTAAKQPTITLAPATASYGTSFALNADTAVSRVTLLALSSVTHSVNMTQRFLELAFTPSGETLNVSAPANANLAPPGTYLLFVLDAAGVPSVAKMLKIQ